ncbi:MAG: hypothetical protein A2521_09365 [Deltaproteobacteria bacterium RIFOXYD12_FULL_57_12]|nr:MAG: hypothetical protein A2521_09365 [Deltaproteobacteria bacterium RIFOXYD12_FULL_57_12]
MFSAVFAGGVVFLGLTSCVSAVSGERQDAAAAGPPPVTSQAWSYPKNTRAARAGAGLTDFISGNFVGSARCGVCHDLLRDKAGNDMSISNHWRSTMMANAAKDPFWLAKVRSEVARNPAIKKVIEEKCATCHMPMAATETKAGHGVVAMFDDGFLSAAAKLHASAMDGVSCSLCHQIQDEKLGTAASFSGKYTVATAQPAPGRPIFGPYREPVARTMQGSVGYTPVYGSQTNDSALCATCHTLFTPFVDAAGNVAGEFPEQTPYLEWRHSDFGVNADRRYDIGENPGQGMNCQECHMPHSKEGGVNIARYAPPELQPKDHFSQHHFVGGNVFMLNVLQDNSASLNLAASFEKLEDTKQRTVRQLQNDTADLAIESRRAGDELTVVVRVDNRVGHKFPTGFPSRNAWIHLAVQSPAGVVFESGRPLADGRIAGNDADEKPGTFEPHYDAISKPDQVQIYETIMADTDGAVTYTLLRTARYLKDNRLLPRGFDKKNAAPEIGVYGEAAQDDNFGGGSDLVTYRIKTGDMHGPFIVRAALLYSVISVNFMEDLRRDAGLAEVTSFVRQFDRADKQPVTVAVAQAEIR